MGMLKRMIAAVTLVLALNFLAAAGYAAHLWQSAGLDGEKFAQIKEILYPPAAEPESAEAAEPQEPTALDRLEAVLAREPGLPRATHAETVDEALAAQSAELDRRLREMRDLRRQLALAQDELIADRRAVDADAERLAAERAEQERLAADEGFQATLAFYETMPAKQAKDLFLNLDADSVAAYLAAMKPRSAGKVLKEFKQPDERAFLRQVMDTIRAADADGPNVAATPAAGRSA